MQSHPDCSIIADKRSTQGARVLFSERPRGNCSGSCNAARHARVSRGNTWFQKGEPGLRCERKAWVRRTGLALAASSSPSSLKSQSHRCLRHARRSKAEASAPRCSLPRLVIQLQAHGEEHQRLLMGNFLCMLVLSVQAGNKEVALMWDRSRVQYCNSSRPELARCRDLT